MYRKLLAVFIFSSLSTLSIAESLDINQYILHSKSIYAIKDDYNIQKTLSNVLGKNEYNKFINNFQDYSEPYKLKKENALYIEGRKHNTRDSSAAVIYSDGRVFTATYDAKNNHLTYFTNDQSCSEDLHPAIKVFLKQFNKKSVDYTIVNNKLNLKYNSGLDKKCAIYQPQKKNKKYELNASSENMSNQQMAQKIAASIWGESIAMSWDYNEDVGVVLSKAVNSMTQCSANLSLLPKIPTYGSAPGLMYLGMYFPKIIAYITGIKSYPTYIACISSTALNYRTQMEMASLGI